MRKKILGLVMAALAIGTVGAYAQTESQCSSASCTSTEKQCKKEKKEKCHKKGPRQERVDPFTGIQLTQEQQQKLDNLKAERKAKKEAAKKEEKQAKAAEKKQFDAQVAEILTPEQYNQYKANCETIKAQKKEKKDKVGKAKRGGKGGHPDSRMEKPMAPTVK